MLRASTLRMSSAIGVPVVLPSNTPERISTTSSSRRCVTWREVPGLRRSRSGWMSASESAIPGRAAVDDAADRRPVALAERGDAEELAEGVAGHGVSRETKKSIKFKREFNIWGNDALPKLWQKNQILSASRVPAA